MAGAQGHPAGPVALQQVAVFDHQVTGVTVAPNGRIFVNFPRWAEDAPISVAEVLPGGSIRPFPDAQWNAWRNARKDELDPTRHFVCVQSVVADAQGRIWMLDPAAPAQDKVVMHGPKLVRVDLGAGGQGDAVGQVIAFDETIAPQGSYLNDVRFSPDGRTAYITDSGVRGALVVLDLASGKARRVLDGDPSTQSDKRVQVKADGAPLQRVDGRGVDFSADGIALSRDGRMLYWQAVRGTTLYRVPTAALRDAGLQPAALARQVERVAENGVADGLLIARSGRMYITSPEDSALKTREDDAAELRTWLQDPALRWPDTLAEGPDGSIYVTSSRIPDMQWYKPGNPPSLRTTLFRVVPR